jgi:hypothetical protein
MYLRICGSFKPVKNNWVRNSQTSKYAIRGFAIYRTYLRTAYTVKKVDEVVRHLHLVTQDQFSLVSEIFLGIPEDNYTINIELFR